MLRDKSLEIKLLAHLNGKEIFKKENKDENFRFLNLYALCTNNEDMFKSRSWFGLTRSNPKNRLSLDQLKVLQQVLEKNSVNVSEQNRGLLVESLRCIAEILIWGDQNDGSVFE